MKIFVWERLEKCTNNYHEEGGCVVVAESIEQAVLLANAIDGCRIDIESEHPDLVLDVVQECKPEVFLMPDAGCC